MEAESQVYMKGIEFSTEHNQYEETDDNGFLTGSVVPNNLFNEDGFIAYPLSEGGDNVNYYDSYPVKVLNKDNVEEFVKSLGRCMVVTGGSKFDKDGIDPYFSEYSPEIMFRVGFNVGLRWKSDFVKKMGFKTVSCGSMTEDTAYNARDTSFSCDWLFAHGFALGYYMIEQDEEKERINRQEKEQEKAKEKAKETKSVQNRLSRARKEYKRIEAERIEREKAEAKQIAKEKKNRAMQQASDLEKKTAESYGIDLVEYRKVLKKHQEAYEKALESNKLAHIARKEAEIEFNNALKRSTRTSKARKKKKQEEVIP